MGEAANCLPRPMHLSVELDYDAIHEISLQLVSFCEQEDVLPLEAVASMMLTVARLTSDKTLETEEEIEFLEYIGGVIQAYFATGSVN